MLALLPKSLTVVAAASLTCSVGCHTVFDLDPVAGPDAPRGVALCVSDDFEAPLEPTRWLIAGIGRGVTTTATGGWLQIDVGESVSATQDPYGGIRSPAYDLTGGSLEAEIVDPAAPTTQSESFITIKLDDNNHYDLMVQHGKIFARTVDSGVLVDTGSVFDPVLHRIQRVRHDAATNEVVFEAHGDGTDWLELHRAPFQFDVTIAEADVVAGSFNVAPAYTARFDNVVVYGRCGT